MRLVVFGTLVLLLIVVVLACLYATDLYRWLRKRRAYRNAKWTIEEYSTPTQYVVQLEKLGQAPILVDSIDKSKNQDEFDWDLKFARSLAKMRLASQNDI